MNSNNLLCYVRSLTSSVSYSKIYMNKNTCSFLKNFLDLGVGKILKKHRKLIAVQFVA